MGTYLNPGNGLFQIALNSQIFVDKSNLIEVTNRCVGTMQRFVCVSRPRRFGKSMAADMLTAYYEREEDSTELFQNLKIAECESYQKHKNKYDVIKINMQEFLSETTSVEEMLDMLRRYLIFDLQEAFGQVRLRDEKNLIQVMKDIYYDQKNKAHQYDLWMHSLHVVCNLPRNMENDMLYLSALLHDIGKPESQCRGRREDDPDMHYYGHPKKSMETVRDVVIPELDRQGYEIPCFDIKELLYYVEYHDNHVSVKLKHVRRHTKMVSFEAFQNLMLLQVADAKAHIQLPVIAERMEICGQLAGEEGRKLYQRILNGE